MDASIQGWPELVKNIYEYPLIITERYPNTLIDTSNAATLLLAVGSSSKTSTASNY